MSKIHKIFTGKCADWNILNFLEECGIEDFKEKVDTYITSLQTIADTQKGIRSERAR